MARRDNEARLRSPTKYSLARRGVERRGEAWRGDLSYASSHRAICKPSLSSRLLRWDRSELGRSGESRVAMGLVQFAMGYRHGFEFPLL
ncbi:hypothetical protein FCV25MIE_18252 [Fagus crenata]